MDAVFRALADPSRRLLLDRLRERGGQTLGELGAGLAMSRQAVTKHLAVLVDADLVVTRRHGHEKWHHLNAAPLTEIADRWIHRFHHGRAHALADLKHALEGRAVSTASPTAGPGSCRTSRRCSRRARSSPSRRARSTPDPTRAATRSPDRTRVRTT